MNIKALDLDRECASKHAQSVRNSRSFRRERTLRRSRDTHHRPARGSAVLLALVAVGVATLLGLSLAATRDANVAASHNLAHAASARAAAAGALELAVELLADAETSDPQALVDADGVLFDQLAIGDATANARVVDLATGLAAGPDSDAVELVVQGVSGGIAQIARAVGRMPRPNAAPEADLDCSEFALLATGSLSIEGDALLALWPNAPLAVLAEPVAYGVADGSRSRISTSPNASLHGTVALCVGSFALDEAARDENLAEQSLFIPATIHVPMTARPEERTVSPESESAGAATLDGYVAFDMSPDGDMRVPARAATTIRGVRAFDVGGDLRIERGSNVRVEGEAAFVVRGDLVIEPCNIEVAPGAMLSMLVIGDVVIESAYVGGERSNPEEFRDATGRAGYDGGASRVSILVEGASEITLREGSVVKGELYAPRANVSITSRSAMYGRVLGANVTLGTGTAIFYDPALDSRRGWSARSSGIWTESGAVQPSIREVERLSFDDLSQFAEATGISPTVSPAFVPVALESQVADVELVEARNGTGSNAREGRVRTFARGIITAIQTQIANRRGVLSRAAEGSSERATNNTLLDALKKDAFTNDTFTKDVFTSLGFDTPRAIDD
ncbi:MAG: hypothetical protein RL591_1948 [Planctomycetota bacterium]